MWRPIGLWDVEAVTFSRQSAHRWQWGCQPYAPAVLYTPGRILVLISVKRLSRPQGHSEAGRTRWIEKSNDLIGNRTRDLPACSIVPQLTTLPRAPIHSAVQEILNLFMEPQGSFGITEFLDFVNVRILKSTKFWKVELFPFSGVEAGHTYSAGSLR
jgi:hypothetical protein